ncbi:MAG: hypothetical protein INQ03_04275 [Candidatus Heimdallarchaeota archaeon]|nr:hypothetical protein [Candidatus Heimdallarchaeota archaeon]
MKKQLITLLMLVLLSLSIIPLTAQDQPARQIQQRYIPDLDETNTWYHEQINMWLGSNGHLWSSVGLSGYPMNFGELDTSEFQDPTNLFLWGGFSTWQAHNPWEENVQFDLVFQTNDPAVAEFAGNQLIALLDTVIYFEVYFDGSWGEDRWTGEDWEQVTHVSYRGHVDWTNMQVVVDASVPRNYGGLAETIDVFAARNLNYWFWKFDANKIAMEINLEFKYDFMEAEGGHLLTINDFIHTSEIKRSSYADNLKMYISLPDVTNPILNPGNTSYSDVYWYYHPSPERQNDYEAWHADFTLYDTSAVITDMTLSFDYTFIQDSWINRDNLWWNVDPRGFDTLGLSSTGKDRARLTENFGANLPLSEDILYFELEYYDVYNYFVMRMMFDQQGNKDAEISAILADLSVNLGLDFSQNSSEWVDEYTTWFDWNTQTRYNSSYYEIQMDMSPYDYTAFVESVYGYQQSAMMMNSTLDELVFFTYRIYPDKFGDYGEVNLYGSSIHYTNLPGELIPYDWDHAQSSHFIDLYNPANLGWNGIPWNNQTDQISLSLNVPFNGDWNNDIEVRPQRNNGIGYTYGIWEDSYGDIDKFGYNLNLYTTNPLLTEHDGSIIGPIDNFNISFNYDFLDRSVDIEAPHMDQFLWRDYNYVEYDWFNHPAWNGDFSNTFSGEVKFAARVNDIGDGGHWYNETSYQWFPKFPGSGISEVNITLFRDDSPVNNEEFLFVYQMEYNSTNGDQECYTKTIDTTVLPDGDYEMWMDLSDIAGNVGQGYGTSINLQNYAGTPDASIDMTSMPAKGAHVADIVQFNWSITDDKEVFTTVLWIGLGGYIVDPYNVVDNGDGSFTMYYTFSFDTIHELENRPMTILIETLDMNGNWIRADTSVVIDNIPTGNPPTIALVEYPENNAQVNASENPILHFEVSINEDVGVASVELIIGDLSFAMQVDGSNYFVDIDLSTWQPDTYNWYIEVTDMDENTHTVQSPTLVFTLIGEGPLVEDTEAPNLTLLEPNNGDTVSGEITILVSATDDFGINSVKISLPDGSTPTMSKDGDEYSYNLDTAEYADDEYQMEITATDNSGKTTDLLLILNFENGRTQSGPTLGLPGFELLVALIAIISIPVLRRKSM